MKTISKHGSPALPYQECSLERPAQCHFCQIHQDESSLTSAAIRYLQLGAVAGENLVMITSKVRQERILNWLNAAGLDVARLRKQRRLFVYTAQQLVEALFLDGMPVWEDFEDAAAAMLDEASWQQEKRVRLYGDAVGDLWAAGNHAGAIALEEFWTRVKQQRDHDVAYFCGYVIDALSPRSYSEHLAHLGRPHCYIVPSKDALALAGALDRAGREHLSISLSSAAARDRSVDEPWQDRLPLVFQAALWLNRTHPNAMVRVLSRAKAIYAA